MPPFDPDEPELDERMAAVMHVLYLIFNEGHTAVSGSDISRPDLAREAIRLTRELVKLRPGDAEAEGLLALMLLTDARRAARTTESGDLVLLADQDRRRWDRALIDEGVALVSKALARHELGPYQLQAAIAAVHDEAPSDDETDWAQILMLHELPRAGGPEPHGLVRRAVAVAKVHGGSAGLDVLDSVAQDERVRDHYRLQAVAGLPPVVGGRPGGGPPGLPGRGPPHLEWARAPPPVARGRPLPDRRDQEDPREGHLHRWPPTALAPPLVMGDLGDTAALEQGGAPGVGPGPGPQAVHHGQGVHAHVALAVEELRAVGLARRRPTR